MTRLRLDPMGLQDVFDGNDVALKLHSLHEVGDGFYDWDIVPAKSILRGLEDDSSEVRIATLNLICCWPERFPDEAITRLFDLISDSVPRVRLALLERLPNISFHIKRSDIEKVLPLIKHKNAGIRSAVIQICDFVPQHLGRELCLELIEIYRQSDSEIQHDIYELLNSMGHGALLNLDIQEEEK